MERSRLGSSRANAWRRKLYLALGHQRRIQHVVGMKGSRTIVAGKQGPRTPIFEIADNGIVGDIFEVMPALTEELHKTKA